MSVHKALMAFTNTTSGSGVTAALEKECHPLKIPDLFCRLWKSHSTKSSMGLAACIVAITTASTNLVNIGIKKEKD